jgi:guanine deaminase
MSLAINEAKNGIKNGQAPFGAVIVKDLEVISSTSNRVWETTDITAHAEVDAIRKACKNINSVDLSGCVIYTTCEPCPMCFSAIHWANIDTIYYGATIDDAKTCGFHELSISNKQMKDLSHSEVNIVSDIMKPQCQELFDIWKIENKSKLY